MRYRILLFASMIWFVFSCNISYAFSPQTYGSQETSSADVPKTVAAYGNSYVNYTGAAPAPFSPPKATEDDKILKQLQFSYSKAVPRVTVNALSYYINPAGDFTLPLNIFSSYQVKSVDNPTNVGDALLDTYGGVVNVSIGIDVSKLFNMTENFNNLIYKISGRDPSIEEHVKPIYDKNGIRTNYNLLGVPIKDEKGKAIVYANQQGDKVFDDTGKPIIYYKSKYLIPDYIYKTGYIIFDEKGTPIKVKEAPQKERRVCC